MAPEALGKMLGDVDLPSWINFPDFERVRWVNTGAGARDSMVLAYQGGGQLLAQHAGVWQPALPRADEPAHACTHAWSVPASDGRALIQAHQHVGVRISGVCRTRCCTPPVPA